MNRARIAPTLLILCVLAGCWSVAVALTGGFVMRFGAIGLSSRNSLPAAILSILSGIAALILFTPDRRERIVARLIAAAATVAVVVVAVWKGSFIAGGADMYGYVSQAHLWAAGNLHVDQPLLRDLTLPFLHEALSPLGYRPALTGTSIVPVYSPGLPIVMAVFERVAGRNAVFWVVPLVSGLMVWATYLMGARLAGPLVGTSAALLMATSPVLLGQVLLPMSDVPVAAWWTLALALLTYDRRDAAYVAGLAAGMAILTRPNLVPLTLAPVVLLSWQALRDRSLRTDVAARLMLFGLGAVPACLAIAFINARLYGSPVVSGYGKLEDLYAWKHLIPNLERYPRWMVDIHTPVILLAVLAPLLVRWWRQYTRVRDPRATAICWVAFIGIVFVSYLFYQPYDDWAFLRFILPALPPLFVLTAAALVAILRPLGRAATIVALIVAVAISWHRLHFSITGRTFEIREFERKYTAIGHYIATRLPERAILIAMEHSGSARYYSGRITLRYDYIPGPQLDSLIDQLERLGYHPYILLEEWELAEFQPRFRNHSRLAALDWSPIAWLNHSSKVRIYDPADWNAAATGRSVQTDIIY
jgi:hypothetical protein